MSKSINIPLPKNWGEKSKIVWKLEIILSPVIMDGKTDTVTVLCNVSSANKTRMTANEQDRERGGSFRHVG